MLLAATHSIFYIKVSNLMLILTFFLGIKIRIIPLVPKINML